jgi:hypothetical protein
MTSNLLKWLRQYGYKEENTYSRWNACATAARVALKHLNDEEKAELLRIAREAVDNCEDLEEDDYDMVAEKVR